MRPKKPKKMKNPSYSSPNRQNAPARDDSRQKPSLPDNAAKARGGLLLYGHHPVTAALSNPDRDCLHLFATAQALESLKAAALPPVTELSRAQLDLMLKSKQAESGAPPHQGLILLTKPLDQPDLSDILHQLNQGKAAKRFLILDQVTDPRNVGAILRSARAFGAEALIMTSRNAPEETGALARAAAGALEDVPIVRVNNLARALDTLRDNFVTLAGLSADADTPIDALAATPHLGLVMGAEGSGLRRLTREACDVMASIEMAKTSESLNVSVAAAIALYATRFTAQAN